MMLSMPKDAQVVRPCMKLTLYLEIEDNLLSGWCDCFSKNKTGLWELPKMPSFELCQPFLWLISSYLANIIQNTILKI